MVVQYTVTFNTQGGNPVAPITRNAGTSITLPLPVYPYNATMFDFWATNSNGSGNYYFDGQSYTINANVTLYAQWLLS